MHGRIIKFSQRGMMMRKTSRINKSQLCPKQRSLCILSNLGSTRKSSSFQFYISLIEFKNHRQNNLTAQEKFWDTFKKKKNND